MYMCIFKVYYKEVLPLSKVRTTSFSGSDAGCFSRVLGRDDALFQKKWLRMPQEPCSVDEHYALMKAAPRFKGLFHNMPVEAGIALNK